MLPLGKFLVGKRFLRCFRHNSFDAVQFLVEKAGVDVDQKDRRGRTALDHALKAENADIIQYLKSQNEDHSRSSLAARRRMSEGSNLDMLIE